VKALVGTTGTGRRLVRPLCSRNFGLLWAGTAVSLVGDGVYLVAIAWQVLELSNSPTALGVVGVAYTLPCAAFLLTGGLPSDRYRRRNVLLVADGIRGVVVGVIAVLSLTGGLGLGQILLLVALYGVAMHSLAQPLALSFPTWSPEMSWSRPTRSTSCSGRWRYASWVLLWGVLWSPSWVPDRRFCLTP
jgi:MFS family permease